MRLSGILVIVLAIFFASCGPQKKLPSSYIENAPDSLSSDVIKVTELTIQKNDLLSIQLFSNSTKPDISDAQYNPTVVNGTPGSSGGGNNTRGYLVDLDGNIKFPRVGVIHAEGLTKTQLADSITAKITDLEDPTVLVRFLNYRISVLGEVGKPGNFVLPNENITIFEAIGLAGDITVTGKKNNVRVIRELHGNRQIGTIDLTSKDVFQSPYYNLQQNDVVIVEVKKSKANQLDQTLQMRRITFALSLVSGMVLLYNIFK